MRVSSFFALAARSVAAAALAGAIGACSPAAGPPVKGLVREGTPDAVNIALARSLGARPGVSWLPFARETFERAAAERRFVIIDASAEWCHWCHVMDATTYADPEVVRAIQEKFIAIRVDVDERPDLAERYGAWGWPATIVLSPEAEELGKYRGYLPPAELLAALSQVVSAPAAPVSPEKAGPRDSVPPVEAMAWIAGRTTIDLDAYYDPEQGGWGRRQKAPLGANVTWEVVRASHGDKAALDRARFTLRKQRALIDPVWGGIYQYSVGGTWGDPHFEKLMTDQAPNLVAATRVFAATKEAEILDDARNIARYMSSFLTGPDGAFLPAQDADLGGHDPGATFVDGHVYYKLGDAERRKLGIPRVDPNVYPHENGLAIAAFVSLHEVTRDEAILAAAKKAADTVLRDFVSAKGEVTRKTHAGTVDRVRYLADAASFGLGLVRLFEATSDAKYRDAAARIAAQMTADLFDPGRGLFHDHTEDADAAGVFARRQSSPTHNITAARFLLALHRATGDAALADRGRLVLRSLSTPRILDALGRTLGDYLLAVDEAGLYPW